MNIGRRIGGSAAFHNGMRRGRASASASPNPERVLRSLSEAGSSVPEISVASGLGVDEIADQLRIFESLGLVQRALDGERPSFRLSKAGRRALDLSLLAVA